MKADKIFDTHAHYDHKQFDNDRDALLGALPQNNVGLVLNVGCDMKASRASVKLAEKYDYIYATVGVHPHDARTLTEKALEELVELAKHKKVVAYGEIGLDFNRNFSPADVQRKWFKRQLEAANELKLPLIIHSRDADDEVHDILANTPHHGGVVHAFPGNFVLARSYTDMGFYLGIGGIITYDKIGRLKAVVDSAPLDKILLETDCPYLTPVPFRGKRNESAYLTYVVDEIAQIKDVTPQEVRTQTYLNACKLFNI
ncbi:MAG: TatD family hydrolase [Defluviitaleaceae bacterium]|nr:TatD family hydrolase [Defluviitaleaceae bacterium]MCL2273520.1 TatD family hydrolase [Defluviitaleaceae bacterium]